MYQGQIKFINESKNVALVTQESVTENVPTSAVIGIGDGVSSQFFGTIMPKVELSDVAILVNEATKTVSVSNAGVLSGADINSGGINQINAITGACAVCFSGTAGTPSSITGSVDLSSGIDFSDGPYQLTLVVDGKTYTNITFDQASTSLDDICIKINSIVKYDVAFNAAGYLKITGATAKLGEDVECTGDAAVAMGIDGTASSASDPTGAFPAKNSVVKINAQSTYSDVASSTYTMVKGDFSAVSVGDSIYYSFTYSKDPNKDDSEITIA